MLRTTEEVRRAIKGGKGGSRTQMRVKAEAARLASRMKLRLLGNLIFSDTVKKLSRVEMEMRA